MDHQVILGVIVIADELAEQIVDSRVRVGEQRAFPTGPNLLHRNTHTFSRGDFQRDVDVPLLKSFYQQPHIVVLPRANNESIFSGV